MVQFIGNRMELEFLHNRFVHGTVDIEFNEKGGGRIYYMPEIIFMCMEMDHFGTTVHYTWNMTGFSQIAGRFFTQFGAPFCAD